jgi:phospholipid transport system substrate-binding protein
MSKFVLGRHYRKLEDDQKDKYQSLYRDLVVYTYIPRFREYAGEEINFYDSIDKGDGEYIVKSALKTAQAKGDVLVDYRVRKDGNTYKILDIVGEGVSLITTQRSDFAAPISRKGMDFFLDRLEKKVESLKSKSFD